MSSVYGFYKNRSKVDFPDLALVVAQVPIASEQGTDVWHLDVGGTALAHLGRVVPVVAR